jgi:hypothetical protein
MIEGIDLRQSEIDLLVDGARQIPDPMRGAYFRYVASCLRPLRSRRESDGRRAVGEAVKRYGAKTA